MIFGPVIMKRQQVQSSALQSVGYDPENKILELEFRHSGGVWQYFKLSSKIYNKFIHAPSLGNYFVTKIKGKYREMKVA
ncbi:MAG: hypothetical protein JWQ66_2599 [Mucilaginibacter sp.]|nr:hypothetical protein [Mucilaginibacter sp.]